MTVYIPLFIALIGAVVYILASNAKAQELGRIAYFCGLLVFTAEIAGNVISILK